eukprot:6108294-Ditylum_brightwellii.AAC.1
MKGAMQMNSANDIGTKVKSLLVKLYAAHGKETINIFSETKRHLKVETFSKTAKEVKDLLEYEMINGQYKTMTMILHVTGLILIAQFKNRVLNWLKFNNIFLNMTIFCNMKETVTRIYYLTKVNIVRIYCTHCQDQLNEVLDIMAAEVQTKNPACFTYYGAMVESAIFEVHIKPAEPNIIAGQDNVETEVLAVYLLQSHVRIAQDLMLWVAPYIAHNDIQFIPANLPHDKSIQDDKKLYAQLLKEQNQYLAKYDDFRIGGISDDMLSKEFDGKTLRGHLELPGVVGNITKTVFTTKKGIWQVETTKLQVL